MTQKVTVEEEQRLITSKGYIETLRKKIIIHEGLEQIKINLIKQHETTILGIVTDIANIKECKIEINDILNDEVFDDLYMNDPIAEKLKQYMKLMDGYTLKKEQQVRIIIDSLYAMIDIVNDIGFKPITRTVFMKEGEILLADEEKKALKSKIGNFILMYKKFHEIGKEA